MIRRWRYAIDDFDRVLKLGRRTNSVNKSKNVRVARP
jgi:hypothetical protein